MQSTIAPLGQTNLDPLCVPKLGLLHPHHTPSMLLCTTVRQMDVGLPICTASTIEEPSPVPALCEIHHTHMFQALLWGLPSTHCMKNNKFSNFLSHRRVGLLALT